MRVWKQGLWALLGVGLVACQPTADDVPSAAHAEAGVTLSATAEPQTPCDPAAAFVANVQWDVRDVDDPLFELRLNSTQGQLWAKVDSARGERRTEAWAHAGMWVVLLDARSQRVLATTQVPPLVCP